MPKGTKDKGLSKIMASNEVVSTLKIYDGSCAERFTQDIEVDWRVYKSAKRIKTFCEIMSDQRVFNASQRGEGSEFYHTACPWIASTAWILQDKSAVFALIDTLNAYRIADVSTLVARQLVDRTLKGYEMTKEDFAMACSFFGERDFVAIAEFLSTRYDNGIIFDAKDEGEARRFIYSFAEIAKNSRADPKLLAAAFKKPKEEWEKVKNNEKNADLIGAVHNVLDQPPIPIELRPTIKRLSTRFQLKDLRVYWSDGRYDGVTSTSIRGGHSLDIAAAGKFILKSLPDKKAKVEYSGTGMGLESVSIKTEASSDKYVYGKHYAVRLTTSRGGNAHITEMSIYYNTPPLQSREAQRLANMMRKETERLGVALRTL